MFEAIEEEEKQSAETDGERRDAVLAEGSGEAGEGEEGGEVGEREAGARGVFPGVDQEAVEGAERGEEEGRREERADEVGVLGERGDGGRRGEAEADDELFRKRDVQTVRDACVEDEEVEAEDGGEEEIETEFGRR